MNIRLAEVYRLMRSPEKLAKLLEMIFDQSEFDLRCEWGELGVEKLAAISDVVIIVDVLSFSTCVEIATNNKAIVFPYPWRDDSAADYAESVKAELAKSRGHDGYSLSPATLVNIPAGTRLVLPSPNGSLLSLRTGKTPTLAGCFRNCGAIAQNAQTYGAKIAVIPAGERWENGSLRPAWEDLIGAGAILNYLEGKLSPEAEAAVVLFQKWRDSLGDALKQCSSGKELIARGFATDVEIVAALNVSNCVPVFADGAYVNQN